MKAYVVEDNPDDIDLITHACRKAQVRHPVMVAPDGEQAIDYLASASELRARFFLSWPPSPRVSHCAR